MAPPILLSIRSSYWFILSTICIAVFTDIFLYGLIVPVLPFALAERAGVPAEDVQHWISVLLAVYGAALLALSPLCGWLADKSPSRRLPLLFGLLALGGATVLLCLGRSISALVVGRLLQGFSAAVVWVVGLALLVDTVGQELIGQAMGYVSLAISLGILFGPLLGGIVYGRAGYYPVYYMAFALIFVDILLRLFLVEKKVAMKWVVDETWERELEDTSQDEKEKAVSAVVPATSPARKSGEVAREGADPPETKRSRLPPVVTLLASRRLDAALWGCMIQAAIMTAFDSVVPLRVKHLWGWDSTGAGLVFLAIVVPSFTAPIIGRYSDHHGPRWFTVAGFVLGCPVLTLLRLVDHDSLRQKVLFCALLVLLGVILNMALTPLMAEITYVVAAKEKKSPGLYGEKGAYAQAYGLFNTAFAAGTLIGPLWGGFVLQKSGWSTMAWTLGLLSVFSAIPAAIWTGGVINHRHDAASRWNGQEAKDERTSNVEQGELALEVK